MSPHASTAFRQSHKPNTWAIALLLPILLLCGVGIVSSTAQAPPPEERQLEDRIPKHLPIKIKVKNLNNEKWLRDLEIEVKNTGDKPIYFLSVSLFFIDVKRHTGDQIGYPLHYGRPELVDISLRATPADVPINPGETCVLKVPASAVEGWEHYKSRENKPDPQTGWRRISGAQFRRRHGFCDRWWFTCTSAKSCLCRAERSREN